MSFTEEKRTRIKNYMLEKIFKKQADFAKKTADTFDVSLTSVYNYLARLVDEGVVIKKSSGQYELVRTVNRVFEYNLEESKLEEDIVYNETLAGYVKNLSPEINKIWEYSFMEMFNNVIDHSQAKNVKIVICQNALSTWVNIWDNGIGIFKKISDYYNYSSLDEAILSLFKGKLTTDEDNHSGEGIFFTSRLMDHFGAISSNKYFSQDNTLEMIKDLERSSENTSNLVDRQGTVIIMALSNSTNKTMKEVFDMYSSIDGGFTVTQIPIKHICDSGFPVSRSQAKRLYFGFDKFEKVILDFEGVNEIGQGFAHELFHIFQKRHPEIEIVRRNTNENIEKMVNRVTM